jgi:hypothetical protein
MDSGALALVMFTWILGSGSAEQRDRAISRTSSFKDRNFLNGDNCDLPRDPGRFRQCPAFQA